MAKSDLDDEMVAAKNPDVDVTVRTGLRANK
jgi:hypothetical protein